MLFLLKQLLKASIMPLPVLLLLGFVGVYLLWRNKRPRLGKVLVTTSFLLLFLLSIKPPMASMGIGLERQHPVFSAEAVDFIVVLGSGHTTDPDLPPTAWISPTGIYRVVEGVRLAQLNPEATVVFSGYGGPDLKSNAEVNGEVASGLGLDPSKILLNPSARDTRDEARFVATLVDGRPFALVTSATHMARAMRIFQAEGLDPIPAPAGYLIKNRHRMVAEDVIPSATGLLVARQLWYEALGSVWARVRGG